jgi:DNA (cytosine-5)-methyltransferase 1
MRFGSVCSGIEAASVAWHPLGWQAAWLAEIEPFPSAVLAHHYPDVPNHGDMTLLPEKILAGEVEAPDLFCGGTPCQAFSVAGLRNSLDDARGNLSLTFVGIANAIDHVRSVRRDDAAIIFWENVPGVLSTKDNAFGCFLGALAGEDEPIIPSGEKWTNAGCVYGPQRTVAWRILDAQYFGVAQRRRRVFVVASARDDFDPAEILFEFQGVRRDIAPSREKGQEPSGTIAARFGISRNNHEECVTAPTKKWPADIASTLDTTFGTKQGLKDQHVNAGCPLFVPAKTFSTPAIGNIVEDEVASTMTKHTGSGGETQNPAFVVQAVSTFSCSGIGAYTEDTNAATLLKSGQDLGNGCEALVAQPIPIDSMNHISRPDHHSMGDFEPGAAMYTLTKGHHHAVAQPVAFVQNTRDEVRLMGGDGSIVGALAAETGAKQQCYVAQPMAFGIPGNWIGRKPENGGNAVEPMHDVAPCQTKTDVHGVATAMQVRRLLPVECERLQGFPDNYTAIPWRKKGADECPDGPRYKALGNSWAVPVVRWIGQRIQSHLQ